MRLKSARLASLGVAPLCLAVASAYANPNDSLQLSASYSISHDDNLFRLGKGLDAASRIGRDSPAETIKAATGTLSFIKDYGLQHVDLQVSAVNYDYQNFSYLNFSALNYTGAVRWSLTPRIRGNFTADRQETLTSFGDFQSFGVRNQRIVTNTRFDGIYELDGAWQLTAGGSRQSLETTATVIEQRAYVLQSVDVGVKRVYGSGTEAAYRLRKGSGDYTTVSYSATAFLPSNFNDTEHELRLAWPITGKSQLAARLSYLQRKYNSFDFRDYSGVTARTDFNWGITAQTRLQVALARELGDYQSNYSSYSKTDRLTLSPTWQIKEKLALRFRQDIARRSFSGPVPGLATGDQREDKIYQSRLSVEWQPREQIDLSAWLQQDKRDSNFSGFSFVSRSIGLLAQVSF